MRRFSAARLSTAWLLCACLLSIGCAAHDAALSGPMAGNPPASTPGAGAGAPGSAANSFGSLPRPSQLARAQSTTAVNTLDGQAFDPLHSTNVTATGTDALFSPHYQPGQGSAGLAIALYL